MAVSRREYEHILIFIGIDLPWQSDKNHTGAAAFEGDADGILLRELSSGLSTLGAYRDDDYTECCRNSAATGRARKGL